VDVSHLELGKAFTSAKSRRPPASKFWATRRSPSSRWPCRDRKRKSCSDRHRRDRGRGRRRDDQGKEGRRRGSAAPAKGEKAPPNPAKRPRRRAPKKARRKPGKGRNRPEKAADKTAGTKPAEKSRQRERNDFAGGPQGPPCPCRTWSHGISSRAWQSGEEYAKTRHNAGFSLAGNWPRAGRRTGRTNESSMPALRAPNATASAFCCASRGRS